MMIRTIKLVMFGLLLGMNSETIYAQPIAPRGDSDSQNGQIQQIEFATKKIMLNDKYYLLSSGVTVTGPDQQELPLKALQPGMDIDFRKIGEHDDTGGLPVITDILLITK